MSSALFPGERMTPKLIAGVAHDRRRRHDSNRTGRSANLNLEVAPHDTICTSL
jgi:hypothetical protein